VWDSKVMQFLRTKKARLLAAGLVALVAGFFVFRQLRVPSWNTGHFVPLNSRIGIQLAGDCLFDCLLRADNSVLFSFRLSCRYSGTTFVMMELVGVSVHAEDETLGSALAACCASCGR